METARGGGMGLAGTLTVVFVTLKLCGVIAWPWIWVLAPLWISLVIGVFILILVIIFG